ncbi:unnamed protein product, partial [Amoebophrya sp. A25]
AEKKHKKTQKDRTDSDSEDGGTTYSECAAIMLNEMKHLSVPLPSGDYLVKNRHAFRSFLRKQIVDILALDTTAAARSCATTTEDVADRQDHLHQR